MYEALAEMPAPSVLVVQDVSGAPSRCALAGEVMASLAMRLGAVGMVTYGGVRDLAEIFINDVRVDLDAQQIDMLFEQMVAGVDLDLALR